LKEVDAMNWRNLRDRLLLGPATGPGETVAIPVQWPQDVRELVVQQHQEIDALRGAPTAAKTTMKRFNLEQVAKVLEGRS
jgi:hypothetical protein